MIHILPRYTLFPYTDALPIYADTTPGIDEMRGVARRHLRYAARRIVAQWSLQRSGVRDSQGRGSVPGAAVVRSEERRVGKECRTRRGRRQWKKHGVLTRAAGA